VSLIRIRSTHGRAMKETAQHIHETCWLQDGVPVIAFTFPKMVAAEMKVPALVEILEEKRESRRGTYNGRRAVRKNGSVTGWRG
jgi:hypothetical protein